MLKNCEQWNGSCLLAHSFAGLNTAVSCSTVEGNANLVAHRILEKLPTTES